MQGLRGASICAHRCQWSKCKDCKRRQAELAAAESYPEAHGRQGGGVGTCLVTTAPVSACTRLPSVICYLLWTVKLSEGVASRASASHLGRVSQYRRHRFFAERIVPLVA